MSDQQTQQRQPGNNVSDLNLKYLEASFESFRRVGSSLILLNAGAILALIGLFPIFASKGVDLPSVAIGIECPLILFIVGIFVAICSLLAFYLSTHNAAWGRPKLERNWGLAGIVSLIIATILFAGGAWSAIDAISDPTLMKTRSSTTFKL